ncbi:13882_t:CDS:2, partial [Cetraspora pellucida]
NELEIEEIRVRVVLSRFKYFPLDQDYGLLCSWSREDPSTACFACGP